MTPDGEARRDRLTIPVFVLRGIQQRRRTTREPGAGSRGEAPDIAVEVTTVDQIDVTVAVGIDRCQRRSCRALPDGSRLLGTASVALRTLPGDADWVGGNDCLDPNGPGHERVEDAFLAALGL